MIFDAHAHLPPGVDAPAKLLAMMDRAEIERAVVIPGGVVTPNVLSRNISFGGGVDVTPDNERVATAARASGGRLVPFFFANPHADVRHYDDAAPGFAGLKLGPAVHGVPFTDPRIEALLEVAATHRHPVYLHVLARPGFTVEDVAVLARKLPAVPIIIGHAAGGQCEFHALDTMADVQSLLLETSGGFTSFVAASVRRLGAARVLFGSEYPLQDPRAELAKLRCVDLSGADADALLGGNIARLLEGRPS